MGIEIVLIVGTSLTAGVGLGVFNQIRHRRWRAKWVTARSQN